MMILDSSMHRGIALEAQTVQTDVVTTGSTFLRPTVVHGH